MATPGTPHQGTPPQGSAPQGAESSLRCVVLTVDQRSSRTEPDAVPAALALLDRAETVLPFVRTAGDEIQGALTSAEATTIVLERLLRDGRWHVGIGLGTVTHPLPEDTRAARGSAFLAAREAVEASTAAPRHPRVVAGPDADPEIAGALESALWLWDSLLQQRTDKGWEVVDLLDAGLSHREAAERLAVAQSAVTQRAAAARLHEGIRARQLVQTLLGWHLTTDS